MEEDANRSEADRLLGIAEKLLQGRDLNGSRDFAILAQEADPFLETTDQIVAVADVLLAAEERINNHRDWYGVLQIERRSGDLGLIKKQYRRLALLLHPKKNHFAFADAAFALVEDAWAVLSNSARKSAYDNELSLFSKVDSASDSAPKSSNQNQRSSFWTACPYCYNLYEYPRVYEGCCLRCQNCGKGFHGAVLPAMPPLVPGKEEYYYCWGNVPVGYVIANSESAMKAGSTNWAVPAVGGVGVGFVGGSQAKATPGQKRGRPRKNVIKIL
ncbi:chaperone DnaJ-domain superfamily protein [Actinidia rufa]|uniref:Chaperone DnaJ-domain superfamily protein n=1 Tax=Actinidia rufa TaxID=165716 RepID=A0A7J0EJ02_9ERIC|nr:chaperone DnaJ-domain superfamily protein [Actinidia rufa]